MKIILDVSKKKMSKKLQSSKKTLAVVVAVDGNVICCPQIVSLRLGPS